MPHRLAIVLRRGMVLLLAAVVMSVQTVPSFAHVTREDAAKARVEKLGVGQHVMVKTLGGEELHGNITVIGDRSFKVKPDTATAEREIAYSRWLRSARIRGLGAGSSLPYSSRLW